jgi:hypothetical protein
MKELLSKIIDKLKRLIPFRKVNPHVYWNSLLYIFCITIILLILFSLYMLYDIKNQQALQIAPTTSTTQSLINEKLLDKVNASFDSNQIKTKEIQNGLTSYKDPSLK